MTLTEFLLARIAEDEVIAESKRGTGFFRFVRVPHAHKPGAMIGYWLDDWQGTGFIGVTEHIARHDPVRVIAECEAKRRIVELHTPIHICENERNEGMTDYAADEEDIGLQPCPTLRAIASVYAAHQDYREEWRPDTPNLNHP